MKLTYLSFPGNNRSSLALMNASQNLIKRNDEFKTAWKVSKYGVFSGLYFAAFGLNTGGVSLCIQSECGKIRTRKNSVSGHFCINCFRSLDILTYFKKFIYCFAKDKSYDVFLTIPCAHSNDFLEQVDLEIKDNVGKIVRRKPYCNVLCQYTLEKHIFKTQVCTASAQ